MASSRARALPGAPRKRSKQETDLSASIVKLLGMHGFWVMRTNSGAIEAARGGWVKLCDPGTPDLLLVAPYGWIEVKRKDGVRKPSQIRWHARARAKGVRVATVRSMNEALETATIWRKEDAARASREPV